MMTSWFHRARQTRTSVHDESALLEQKQAALRKANRLTASLQMAAQWLLWIAFFAYDRSVQTVWQAALMLALPLFLLLFVWKKGEGAVGTRAGAWWALPLVVCLMADAALLLRAFSGYIGQLIPEYPSVLDALVPLIACYVSVLLSRRNGAAYGIWALKWLFALLFLTSTVFQGVDVDAARLWPVLGQGLGQTALTALMGCGCVWGVALLFLVPQATGESAEAAQRMAPRKAAQPVIYALIPFVMGLLWALWYALVRPWRPDDALVIGERLMGLARHSPSTILYELTGLWWMLLLPSALIASLTAGERLLRAVWPGMPRSVAALIPALPALVVCLGWPDVVLGAFAVVFPLRAAVSLVCGVGMMVTAHGRGRGE